jgi:hypothetical protein
MDTIYDTITQIIKEHKYKYVMYRGFGMGLQEFKNLWSDRDGEILDIEHQTNYSLVETEYGFFKLF